MQTVDFEAMNEWECMGHGAYSAVYEAPPGVFHEESPYVAVIVIDEYPRHRYGLVGRYGTLEAATAAALAIEAAAER